MICPIKKIMQTMKQQGSSPVPSASSPASSSVTVVLLAGESL
jgi:hypothetical protein